MKKSNRDFIQETIEDMRVTVDFGNEGSIFMDDEDGLLDALHLSEVADVLQFIDGYDEPHDFPTEEGD